MGSGARNGALPGFGRVHDVSGTRIFEGQVHRVLPIIQVDHIDRDFLDCGSIQVVGKNLEGARPHSRGRTGNGAGICVEGHPGRKIVRTEMSGVARSLDPVVEWVALGRSHVTRTGDRWGYLAGTVTEQVGRGFVFVGGGGPSGALVKRIGKTNTTDRTGSSSTIRKSGFEIIPTGLTEVEVGLLHRIPGTVVDHDGSVHCHVSFVVNVLTERNLA